MGMGHHHGTATRTSFRNFYLAAGVAACMLIAGLGWRRDIAGVPLTVWAAILGSAPILLTALRELLHLRLSADLAVCLAAGAAIAIGQPFVAAEVILIMLIGGGLEDVAVYHTRDAIRALVKLSPREATRLAEGVHERIPIDALCPGDTVLVSPGERLPVDGRVACGHSAVDQAPLTGESLPVDVAPGAPVLAGSVNGAGVLEVVTEKIGADTAFGRMIHLVEHAEEQRAPSQRLADRYAQFFLPVVLTCAGVTYLLTDELVRAVSVLVIACPCALVLATPTAIAAGIGRLARQGVLVKGGVVLETLGRCRSILLDKTGTLTQARLHVAEVVAATGIEEDTVLALAAALERNSEHPVARAVVAAAGARQLTLPAAGAVVAEPGLGIAGLVNGQRIRVGSQRFLQQAQVQIEETLRQTAAGLQESGHSALFVARDGNVLGLIGARDQARSDAAETVARLGRLLPGHVAMLTGDSHGTARALAAELGLTQVYSELLPEDKTRIVRQTAADAGPVAMVGDGINDAAALAAADVGIALTDVGTDVAIEAAGMAIFGEHNLARLPEAVAFARTVRRTIRQNFLVFALALNGLGVAAAGLGWVGPVAAALLHQVSSLLVVANSLRLLIRPGDLGDGFARLRQCFRQHWLKARRPAAVAAVGVYVLSGIFVIAPDEIGIVRRFGRRQPLAQPGIHVRLPWPCSRLDRLRPAAVRRVEIGFRADRKPQGGALPAYEWNIQHRLGRYRMIPEESLMTCGDQSFLEINAVVHYRLSDPNRFLFAALDPDRLMRAMAENALREVVAGIPLARVLTSGRSTIETEAEKRLRQGEALYGLGVEILSVELQDVHPPLDTVSAFRQVVDALEEKEATINQATGYANEQLPLGRGQARVTRETARARAAEITQGAHGGTARFSCLVSGRQATPVAAKVTDSRLYIEALEKALTGPRLTILDPDAPGRRGISLFDSAMLKAGLGAAAEKLLLEKGFTTESPGGDQQP